MGKGIIKAAAVSVTAPPAPPAAGNATLTVPKAAYNADNTQLVLTEVYAPPATLGTFKGVHWYAEVPDQSADSGLVADGSTAWDGTVSAVGNPAVTDLGKVDYTATRLTLTFQIDASRITEPMSIRLRGVSYSAAVENDYASAPSVTVSVNPPSIAKPLAADAYAPIATGLSHGGPFYEQQGNVWEWWDHFAWTIPSSDARFNLVQGYEIQYEYDDGSIGRSGLISDPAKTSWDSDLYTVSDGTIKAWLVTWGLDHNGNPTPNPRVPGITPNVTLTIQRPVGGPGLEYAPKVQNFSGSVFYVPPSQTADGIEQYGFQTSWTPSVDGQDPDMVQIWVYWGSAPADGPAVASSSFYPFDQYKASTGAGVTASTWDVLASATAHLVALSRSRDGLLNTYKHGTTPESGAISISPQTSGGIPAHRLDPSTLNSTDLQIASGQLAVKNVDLTKVLGGTYNNTEFHLVSGEFTVNGVDLSKAISATIGAALGISSGVLGVQASGITATLIANAAVTNNKLDRVSVNKIAIVDADIVSLTAAKITAGTLAAGVAYIGSIATSQILAGTLGAGVIYAGTINTSQINAGSLAAGVIYTGTINATQVNAGTLNAVNLSGGTLALNRNGITVTVNCSFDSRVSTYASIQSFDNASGAYTGITPAIVYSYDAAGNQRWGLTTLNYTSGGASYGQLYLSTAGGSVVLDANSGLGIFQPGWGSGITLGSGELVISGNPVVKARQTGPGNPSFTTLADAQTWCQNLLTALRNHGLVT